MNQGVDPDDWGVHPNGDLNLIQHLDENTTVNIASKWNVADVAKLDELQHYPFLFMHAEVPPDFADAERANLREYLLRGGFLFAEDCVIGSGHMGRISGTTTFPPHGRDRIRQNPPRGEARTPALRPPRFPHHLRFQERPSPHAGHAPRPARPRPQRPRRRPPQPSDLHCGWTNGDSWFGPGQNRIALQMGANIYAYAMTRA